MPDALAAVEARIIVGMTLSYSPLQSTIEVLGRGGTGLLGLAGRAVWRNDRLRPR